jgi:putative FmdB family regulatory protein
MPLYEYLCKKCGHRFERIQKFSDLHVKKCPDCGGAVEQVITAPSVRFKGSGWYVNDYAKQSSESGSSSSSSDNDSGSKAESKSDSKKDSSDSESKSESKKDSKPKSEKKSKKD